MTQSLRSAENDLKHHITANNCHSHVMRLAALDTLSGTKAADGSIMLAATGSDAGLDLVMEILKTIKKQHPQVSYADLIQMGSAVALKLKGGPKVPMRYGRLDNQEVSASEENATSSTDMAEQVSALTSSPLASFRKLIDMGLSTPHSLTLMADFENNFQNEGPVLPKTELPKECATLVSIYSKDDLALTRDYAWAQNKKSEIGATFFPAQGLRI